MAINPAIAMSFQAPKFEDPMNRLVQMEQLKAYQQNALAKQMEMESAREAMAQQKGLRNYLSGLSPNEMPSLGEMAQYGDKGLSMFNALSEAQEKQREAAANIYKEVYLPMLSGAKTAKDVYNWRQAVKSDPRVAPVVTKEADYGLPKTDEEVPAYLERHFVPYSERYKQAAMDKRAQAKLDAEASKSQRPFAVGGSVFFPDSNEFRAPPASATEPKYELSTDAKGNVTRINMNTGEKLDLGLIGKPSSPAKGDIQSFTDNEGNVTAVNMQTGDKTDLGKIGKGVSGENAKPLTSVQKIKLKNTVATDYKALNSLYQAAEEVYKSAEEAKGHPGLEGATGAQSYFPSLPETRFTSGKAAAAETKLENLKGKVTSMGRTVQSMSGAVGSMAVQEWKIMRDAVSALDKAVSSGKSITIEEIENIESFMDGLITRAADTYEKAYGDYFEQYPQELGKFKELPSLKRSGFGQGGEAAPATRSPSQTGSSSFAPPAGIDAETWQFMTPQERALFEGK